MVMEGDGNLCQGTGRGRRKRDEHLITINKIEATEGEEKARGHKEDMKSLRQAERKTGRWTREMKGRRK